MIRKMTGIAASLLAVGSLVLTTAASGIRHPAAQPKINLTLLTFDTGPGILEKPAVQEFMKHVCSDKKL